MRIVTFIVLFVGCFNLAKSQSNDIPAEIPLNGLISWWGFSNNEIDSRGNVNLTAVGGNFAQDRFGNNNSAIQLDGLNEYLYSRNAHQVPTGNQNYSISIWFLPYNFEGRQTMIGWGISKGNGTVNVSRLTSPQEGKGIMHYHWAYDVFCESPDYSNKWTNLVITYDGLENKVYINGELKKSFQIRNLSVNSDELYIGCSKASSVRNEFFKGLLDDIGIWNRPLTIEEIGNISKLKKDTKIVSSNKTNSINNTMLNIPLGFYEIKDVKSGCIVYLRDENISVEWNGICKNGFMNGDGKLLISSDGNPIAMTTCTIVDGFLEGTYVDSFYTSKKLVKRTGSKLRGLEDGLQTVYNKNGAIDYKPHTKGIINGTWISDYSANPVAIDSIGDVKQIYTEVAFEYGNLSEGVNYKRKLSDGTIITSHIDTNGVISGETKIIKSNYEAYGNFNSKIRDFVGIVKVTYIDGKVITGEWANDQFNGEVEVINVDGTIIRGNFLNGKHHGEGVVTMKNGFKLIGKWNHGEFVSGSLSDSKGRNIPFTNNGKTISFNENELRNNDENTSITQSEKDEIARVFSELYVQWLSQVQRATTHSNEQSKIWVTCRCGGSGKLRKNGSPCMLCGGKGQTLENEPKGFHWIACPKCSGSGDDYSQYGNECRMCSGRGQVLEKCYNGCN
jgi:hypothetical protein